MSLASPVPAARPLDDQARSLVGFLQAHDQRLAEADAAQICAKLPADAKAAAKALRTELAQHGIEIKHAHALKAVAVARDADGYLGLGSDVQYVVASYSPDAPGVSSERKGFQTIAEAADEVVRRVRDELEDANPLAKLTCRADHLMVSFASEATASNWNVLVACRRQNGAVEPFRDLPVLQRFAERLRRLVEGEMGGWLDGVYDTEQALSERIGPVLAGEERSESALWHLAGIPETTLLPDMPSISPALPLTLGKPLAAEQWTRFLKRATAFASRHDEPVPAWARRVRAEVAKPRFEPARLNVEAVEAARARSGWSWDDVALRVNHVIGVRVLAGQPEKGRAELRVVRALAAILDVDNPNELLAVEPTAPRIPLTVHTDVAAWLGGMEAMAVTRKGASPAQRELTERLQVFCDVPFEQRRHWDKAPPPKLEALNQEIRFLGLVVCAGVGIRFVRDLPIDDYRPAALSLLQLERLSDVLTQDGRLKHVMTSMKVKREKDPVTPEWLARFNKPRFTANDLLRYSDLVHEYMQDDEDERDSFTSKAMAGVRLFKRDPEKAHAATVRMEALSTLIGAVPMEPWIRKGADPSEGSTMVSSAAFEATARCELVDIDGAPAFEPQAFYRLCVKHSTKYA